MAISDAPADSKLYRAALQDVTWVMDKLVQGGGKGRITWVRNIDNREVDREGAPEKLGRGAKRSAALAASFSPIPKRYVPFVSYLLFGKLLSNPTDERLLNCVSKYKKNCIHIISSYCTRNK